MKKVDIYIETSSTFQGATNRKCGYVLSTVINNEEKTREGFGHFYGTYHQAILITLAEALERMAAPSEICIHTRDMYVASRIPKLEEMAGSDWKDSKGELIKNADEWKRVYTAIHVLYRMRIYIPENCSKKKVCTGSDPPARRNRAGLAVCD